jgi:uncharacterized membrane protein YtjA (UPF0391 family)
MMYWAVVFFVIALISALFGFGGIAGAAVGMSKTLFFIAVIVFLITLVMGMAGRGRSSRLP